MAAPAMPVGEDFQPEAAIVNYFGSGTICILNIENPYFRFSDIFVSFHYDYE